MSDTIIESLRQALKVSPTNVPLKLHLAEILLGMKRIEEAEKEYLEVLALENNEIGLLGLAKVYFSKEAYSTCNVILEDLIKNRPEEIDVLVLYAKSSLREKATGTAIETYQTILRLDPEFRDEELDSKLRVTGTYTADDVEEEFEEDTFFIQNPGIDFNDVGGMENVKKEIEIKIIHPLQHPDLFKAYGKKIGGGILLYGPPGCGKTHIARATAGQVNARFINVGLNEILDMWMGSSEKNLHQIFDYARRNAPCVLFFDEVDALGASRSDMKQSAGRHLINQFLLELDGVEHTNDGVLILGATNTPWHLDPAFRRPGRFDRLIFVPPPDNAARESILQLKLKDKPTDNVDYTALSKSMPEYSGADIEAVIDIAVEEKLEEALKSGKPLPIKTRDLLAACKKHKASTKEWFTIARNFALFANESGLYDDILEYMKIKK